MANKKGILDYLNPLEGWKEGWWDPLRTAGSRLYDLDVGVLGEEEAKRSAEGVASLWDLLSPRVTEEPIGAEPIYETLTDYIAKRTSPVSEDIPYVDIRDPRILTLDPFSRPTVVPTKPVPKKPVTKKTPTKPTQRVYIDVPGPALREPPLRPAPSREGWPTETYGITPEPAKEKVSFLRKLLTGKGTLTGIPYILPILAALSESPQGGRFLQMWSGMRGRKLAAQAADLARLQHVYDLKMAGLAKGIPLSLGDRKRLAAIDPSLLRKHLVSKEVTYRYNRKAKKYMTEDEIAKKGIDPNDLGEAITRTEKNYDWIVKSEGPEYQALRAEKASLAARKYRAKIMDKEFAAAYGRDYVTSDMYKKLRADYVAMEAYPGAKWINVDGGTALFDPKTNTVLASYIDPGMTNEARLKLRTKYQKQLITYTAGVEKPQTVSEAIELMSRIRRTINLDYNSRLQAIASRVQAILLDPDITDEQKNEQKKAIQDEMRLLIQEQRNVLAALDREFSKNPLLSDFFKGKEIGISAGEKDRLFTSQLEKAVRARE